MAPKKGHVFKPVEERFWAKVDRTNPDGCWVWIGARDPKGYGRFNRGPRAAGTMLAHRWSYEQAKGPIPEGMVPDHLCANHPCVRPDHLEAVSPRENFLRGQHRNAQLFLSGHCGKGHPLPAGERVNRSNRVGECKQCKRAWEAVRREGKRNGHSTV